MSDYSEFARLVNEYLDDRDQSATWLAKRLGINPSTTARWCNGETRPNSPELVVRLADVLGIYDAERQAALLSAAGYAYVEGETPATTPAEPASDPPAAAVLEDAAAVSSGTPSSADEAVNVATPASLQATSRPIRHNTAWLPTLVSLLTRPWVQAGVVVLLLVILVLTVVNNQLRTRAGSILVDYFAIGEWQNLSSGYSAHELFFTEGTRRALYAKLSQAPALQGVALDSPQMTPEMRSRLTYWIEGSYQKSQRIQLEAAIYGREGTYLDTVIVTGTADITSQETDICLLDLQNQLTRKILAVLKVEVADEKFRDLERAPTSSCAALRANNQAAELVMQGGFQNAQTLLTRALTLDPHYADARNNLGQLLYRQGDWAGAIARYQEAIALQPTNAVYHYNLGLASERSGDDAGAVAAYEAALALDPLYVQALNNLGFTYLQMGKLTEAATTIQQGLELDANAPYLHKNLGRIYLEQGKPEQAVIELEKALALFADGIYAEAFYYLALAYAQQSQIEAACAALNQYAVVAEYDEPARTTRVPQLYRGWQCK